MRERKLNMGGNIAWSTALTLSILVWVGVGCGPIVDDDQGRLPLVEDVEYQASADSLEVEFQWEVRDVDGDTLECDLDVDGDAIVDYTISDCATNTTQVHTYASEGTYQATLTVRDPDGNSDAMTIEVVVDGDCPEPTIIEEPETEPDAVLENIYAPMRCVDYRVTGDLIAVGDVTVEPGVVMAFDGGALFVGEGSSLEALGTSELPIIASPSSEGIGSWAGIDARGDVRLDGVTLEGAGNQDRTNSNYEAPASITVQKGARLSMSNSTVRDGDGYGVFSDHESTLPTFDSNTITGHTLGPVRTDAVVAHVYNASNTFAGNQVEGISVNPNFSSIEDDVKWEALDVPYFITKEVSTPSLSVPEGSSLTLAAGTRVEFEEGVPLSVRGTLSVDGTADAAVTLTSRDADNTAWGGVLVRDDGTANFDHAELMHGGAVDLTSSNYDAPANLTLRDGASVEMRDSVVSMGAGYGIFADDESELPTFGGNTVTSNVRAPVRTDAPTAHFFAASSSYTGNGDDYVSVNPDFGAVEGDRTWEAIDVPFRITKEVSTPGLAVAEGATLTLMPGAVVHLEEDVPLRVVGTLVSEGTVDARIEIAKAPDTGNFAGILIDEGTADFAYTTIRDGGGTVLGFDDVEANVVLTSFSSDDAEIARATFGMGMAHSGAPYGVAFDNWPGSDGTVIGSGIGCASMAPIYRPEPGDIVGQCSGHG